MGQVEAQRVEEVIESGGTGGFNAGNQVHSVRPRSEHLADVGRDVSVNSVERLRQAERQLAAQYGAEGPPKPIDAEDLECDDLADVEHWVEVYAELVAFTRGLLEEGSSTGASPAGGSAGDHTRCDRKALALQAHIQELHLNYWIDRLNRLRTESGSE